MPEIEILVDPRGHSTISPVDLLEDYWADFVSFREEALVSEKNGDLLRTHRYLRSNLFSFLNYLAGLLNRWESLLIDQEVGGTDARTLFDRLAQFADRFHLQHPPREDIEFLIQLSERFSNLLPADEKELFLASAFSRVDLSESRIVAWLEGIVNASGSTLHANAKTLALGFARTSATASNDDYRCFEALGDEPHPFQDPPGTWEDIDPIAEVGRSPN